MTGLAIASSAIFLFGLLAYIAVLEFLPLHARFVANAGPCHWCLHPWPSSLGFRPGGRAPSGAFNVVPSLYSIGVVRIAVERCISNGAPSHPGPSAYVRGLFIEAFLLAWLLTAFSAWSTGKTSVCNPDAGSYQQDAPGVQHAIFSSKREIQ